MTLDTFTTIIGLVLFPIIGFLFNRFASLKKDLEQTSASLRKEIEHEKDQRQKLELMIAKEYVSRAGLKEIMEPMITKMSHFDRMIERIASRLHVPAIGEE